MFVNVVILARDIITVLVYVLFWIQFFLFLVQTFVIFVLKFLFFGVTTLCQEWCRISFLGVYVQTFSKFSWHLFLFLKYFASRVYDFFNDFLMCGSMNSCILGDTMLRTTYSSLATEDRGYCQWWRKLVQWTFRCTDATPKVLVLCFDKVLTIAWISRLFPH